VRCLGDDVELDELEGEQDLHCVLYR
jgi:hypothetical protein